MKLELVGDRKNNDVGVVLVSVVGKRVRAYGLSIGPPIWWMPRFYRDDGRTNEGHVIKRTVLGWLLFAVRRHEALA